MQVELLQACQQELRTDNCVTVLLWSKPIQELIEHIDLGLWLTNESHCGLTVVFSAFRGLSPVETHSVITHLSQAQTSAGSRSTLSECRVKVIDPKGAGRGFLHRCKAGTSFHFSVIRVLLLEAMQKKKSKGSLLHLKGLQDHLHAPSWLSEAPGKAHNHVLCEIKWSTGLVFTGGLPV